jgi:CheY-like chemotaxis protein
VNIMNPSATERIHILILEDNPADAKLAFLKLEEDGFMVDGEIACNSTEFMARVRSNVYDTILSDYGIPG